MRQHLAEQHSPRALAHRLVGQQLSPGERLSGMASLAFGLLMVLAALHAWHSTRQLLHTGGADAHFIQINKKVSIFNSLGIKPVFSDEELEALRRLPEVEAVGPFLSNRFRVQARNEPLGFYTELFFEAVPDAFLDLHPPDFRWEPGQREVPVILSRDYLALYNFGFAPSHGLPPISPSTIKRFRMTLYLQGNGRSATYAARIAGFSDRINSILVPLDFLEWANDRFGTRPAEGPARLILKVRNPADPELLRWLDAQGYEVGSGRVVGEEVALAVQLVLGFILATGLLIFVLAAALLATRLSLLSARMRSQLARLLELGYGPALLQSVLAARFRRDLLVAALVALVALLGLHFLFTRWLESHGLGAAPPPQWWIFALLALMVAVLWMWYGRVARREVATLAARTTP